MLRLTATVLSFVVLIALAFFLSLMALWVCDGYYPVGWGWRGTLIHLGMWLLPASILIGASIIAFGFYRRAATALILLGVLPFAAAIFLVEIEPALKTNVSPVSPWAYLWFIAPIVAFSALWGVYSWAGFLRRSPD